MTATPDAKAVESLLAFWVQAGVDATFADAPVNRTTPPPKPARQTSPAAPAVVATLPWARNPQAPADIAPAVEEAKALAASAQDLDTLASAIAGFNGCALKFEGARQSVFCRGNPTADIMVIGEGPGRDEDVIGQPFVGRAGQLLDRMLTAAGLLERTFITNSVFWRPPGNRTPTSAEQAACQPFVEKAIFLVKPQYLLFVGGASAKFFLKREDGILTLRGRWFEWSSSDGSMTVPALPTLHPAFLLRTPAAKKKAWGDLLTLADRVDRPGRES